LNAGSDACAAAREVLIGLAAAQEVDEILDFRAALRRQALQLLDQHLVVTCAHGPGSCRSTVRLAQHAVEHLQDEALLRLGQACQALDALLQLWSRAALGRGGLLADQGLDADAQGAREGWQGGDGHAAPANFPGSDGLLGDTESDSRQRQRCCQ
jgi:hypothetical protein